MKTTDVKVGDWLTVKREFITRGGQSGEVVDIFKDGVGLDFYCSFDGDEAGVPSIEHWSWGEIEDVVAASPSRSEP